MTTTANPSFTSRQRISLALLIGLLCGGLAFANFSLRGRLAEDFTVSWRAARFLLAAQDPYCRINPAGPYPWHDHFLYPLTAALVAVPFAALQPIIAGSLFFGSSAALLAYAILQEGNKRLPLFLSSPFLVAAAVGQWSPLITAAALLPAMQFLVITKPTIGLAAFAYRPNLKGAAVIFCFLAFSLLIEPSWPARWISDIQNAPRLLTYQIPLLMFFPYGLVLLASVRHWRKPEGRLLLALVLVPQHFWFYDQLMLWLIPRSQKESWMLTIVSWFSYGIWRLVRLVVEPTSIFARPDLYILLLCYLPALCMLFHAELSALQRSLKQLRRSVRIIPG